MPHRKKTRIALHLLVVCIMLGLPIVDAPSPDPSKILLWTNPYLPMDFLIHLFCLAFGYINYFFLVPRYFHKPYKIEYFFLVLLIFLFLAVSPVFILSNLFLVDYFGFQSNILIHELNQLKHVFFLFAFAFIYSTMTWMEHKRRNVEHDISDAELRFLKAQINPHFLFNTLNSIYALTHIDSKKAGEAILKMSSLMRYSLNKSDAEKLPLLDAATYIEHYVDLQKARFGDTVKIDMDINIKGNYQIAQLILLPFIENAFKYGIFPSKPSEVSITLYNIDHQLYFFVGNNNYSKIVQNVESTGIGLVNTQKRLAAIYADRHSLKIEETDSYFKVTLTIALVE